MSSQTPSRQVLSFPSDKNGCGFYRTIMPLNYLTAQSNWNSSFLFQFVFDLNLIRSLHYVRFQRQCTDNQKRCVLEYRKCINSLKLGARIVYELDDVVHGIEPQNVVAYQYYTKTRRDNVIEMMKMSNMITFSTKFLKHFYEREHKITNSFVLPNFLPKFMWNPDYKVSKRPNKAKPVIMWAGSASHISPGGDLEFLLPMIEATVDEFEWLFVGCIPQKLDPLVKSGLVSFLPWQSFYEYPSFMQSLKVDLAIAPIRDSLFNYAKSDLKYLEYAAMNVPAICSSIGNKIGPYDHTNSPNLVDNDSDSWYNAIQTLLKDENKYNETIALQHQYLEKRWMENPENVQLYNTVYRI